MKTKKERCPSCEWWVDDGGGWGFCRNLMPAQDVENWQYTQELTFKTFGCVYHQEFDFVYRQKRKTKKTKKKPSKEVSDG